MLLYAGILSPKQAQSYIDLSGRYQPFTYTALDYISISYLFMIPMRSLISFLPSFHFLLSSFIPPTVIGYFLVVLIYTLIGTFGVDFLCTGWDGHCIGCIGLGCIVYRGLDYES